VLTDTCNPSWETMNRTNEVTLIETLRRTRKVEELGCQVRGRCVNQFWNITAGFCFGVGPSGCLSSESSSLQERSRIAG